MKWNNLSIKANIFIVMVLILFFGAVSANAQTLGDVNSSNSVDIVDALLVAQYYVGLQVTNFNPAYADVNADASVTIVDALLIAQFYVGLIDKFPGSATNAAPNAKFTISDITPTLNQAVTFNASGSSDTDGTIASYAWDFKDGSTATGVSVSHSFAQTDDFNVVLTVTDDDGATATKKNRVFIGRPDGWTEKTHHKSADPNYETLFPEDSVRRLDITISATDFAAMESNLATLSMMSTVDPMYVPCTLQSDGITWWNVGMRYKGQSSLFNAKQSGIHKYPFRLNFDKLETDYPEIKDQRFYGFKEMTFCSSWNDQTFLREKVCSDIFRDGGLTTAVGSFVRVYINTGNGFVYWGLYTMVEDPSDALISTQYTDGTGNCYKPETTGADWRTPFTQSAFIKKTNEDLADWSDVKAAHSALHASRTNATSWRANLDAVFNTGIFLRWLAINTAVTNWDSYGKMAQNYYLYQDVANGGRITWIPWDHNLSLSNAMMGSNLSLALTEVTSSWPLIRFLMDDTTYKATYHAEMRAAMNGCFNDVAINAEIDRLAALIKPYVVGTNGEINGYTFLQNGETGFNSAISTLKSYISQRRTTVATYLATVN
jgi:spore coat protein H